MSEARKNLPEAIPPSGRGLQMWLRRLRQAVASLVDENEKLKSEIKKLKEEGES